MGPPLSGNASGKELQEVLDALAKVDLSNDISKVDMRNLLATSLSATPAKELDRILDAFEEFNDGRWNHRAFSTWLQGMGAADFDSRQRPPSVCETRPTEFVEAFTRELEKEEERIAFRIESEVEDSAEPAAGEADKAALRSKYRQSYEQSHPPWRMDEAFQELVVETVITDLRESLAPGCKPKMEIAFVRALTQVSPDVIVSALQSKGTLMTIAKGIQNIATEVNTTSASTGAELNDKFLTSSDRGFSMEFGTKAEFFRGLEALIGSPDPKLLQTIIQEHCARCDSRRKWTTGNYGINTDSMTELLLVLKEVMEQCEKDHAAAKAFPKAWHDAAQYLRAAQAPLPPLSEWPQEWPKETKHAALGRNPEGQHFLQELLDKNRDLLDLGEEEISLEEGVLLRLYTGPMFEKYNIVPRGGALSGCANKFLESRFKQLCCDEEGGEENRYCTSIHVLNSGVVKLSKLTKVATVYRGLGGNVLPQQFWEEDKFGCKGGVEYGFMSTTLDRDTAMRYAGNGSVKMVLMIDTGSIDRGADMQKLSQYPHEAEILFPPLSSLEVKKTKAVGGVLLVQTRVNVNLRSPTIDEVIAKRYKMLTLMCEANNIEAKQLLRSQAWQSLLLDESLSESRIQRAFQDVIDGRMKEVLSEKATHYNEDSNFLAAIEQLVRVAAHMRLQESSLLRDTGRTLGEQRLLKLADEREEMEVAKESYILNFTTRIKGLGDLWLFRVIGLRRFQDGLYYPMDKSVKDYRDIYRNFSPLASKGVDLPSGRALLSANGRRDLENWAREVQSRWQPNQEMTIQLEFCGPRTSKEFSRTVKEMNSRKSPKEVAAYLLCNKTQKELDMVDAKLSDEWGCRLLEAISLTRGHLELEMLVLSENQFAGNFLQSLTKTVAAGALPHLQVLQLFKNLELCKDMSKLKSLLAALTENCRLQVLHLGGTGLTEAETTATGEWGHLFGKLLQSLQFLTVAFNDVGPSVPMAIAIGLRAAAAAATEPLPLRTLWFKDNPKAFANSSEVFREVMESLGEAASLLEGFRVSNTSLAGKAAVSAFSMGLRRLPELKELMLHMNSELFADSDVGDTQAFFAALGECRMLEDLRMSETGLCHGGEAAASAVRKFSKLRLLNLSRNPKLFEGDEKGSRALLAAVGECESIEEFTVNDTNLCGDDAAEALGKSLKNMKKVRKLWLGNNPELFSDKNSKGTETFLKAIGKCTSLQELRMHDTNLRCEAKALAKALENLPGLEALTLRNARLSFAEDAEGAKVFFQTLPSSCPKLEEFSLANTELGGEAAQALIDALPKMKKLKKLWVSDNDGISGATKKALKEAVEAMGGLDKLST